MRIRRNIPPLICVALVVLLLTACGETKPPERSVSMDMPVLAESLRFVGMCAVACSALGSLALVWSSFLRSRQPKESRHAHASTHTD